MAYTEEGRLSDSGVVGKGTGRDSTSKESEIKKDATVVSTNSGGSSATIHGSKLDGLLRNAVAIDFRVENEDDHSGAAVPNGIEPSLILGDHEKHPTENGARHYYTTDLLIGHLVESGAIGAMAARDLGSEVDVSLIVRPASGAEKGI